LVVNSPDVEFDRRPDRLFRSCSPAPCLSLLNVSVANIGLPSIRLYLHASAGDLQLIEALLGVG
jgi:hypothetical protein